MASAIDLYTIGNMEKATVLSATSAATGYPKERLLDYNPDTFWKPTSTANQTIVIDFTAAQRVDRVFLWIHNYTTNHSNGGSASLKVSYSSDNVSYTQWTNPTIATTLTTDSPILVGPSGLTAQTYRYWKIEFLTMATTIEVSGIFLARKWTLIADEWPERDQLVFANKKIQGPGGRQFVAGINRNAYRIIPRTFYMNATAQYEALEDAFENSRGSLYPLIIIETSGISGAKMVRFTDDALGQNKLGHQIWNPTVNFIEYPHIYPGEAQ